MQSHTFKLANGDELKVSFCDSGYGVSGYRLRVVALSGNLVVQPASNNSIVVTTDRALPAEGQAMDVAAKARADARSGV